jgi:predicted dehydrogenase
VINAAIIGLGGWGRRLVNSVHGKSERIRFAAAVVRRPDRSAGFAAEHGMEVGSDLNAVLEDPAIDAIVVSSAAGVHASQGLAAIEAGKPAMVIKPLGISSAEAFALRDAAKARGQVLALGYNRCFLPANAELRRLVADGALGTALHAEGNFCVDRYPHVAADDWKADETQSPPGALTDHMLYEMIRMLGPVAEATAHAGTRAGLPTLKDTTATLLRFENGATGLLTAIGATADFLRLHVFGTKGWAEIRGTGDFTMHTIDGKSEEKTFPKFDAERAELEALADAIEGRAEFPVTPDQAAHSVAVLEAIRTSAGSGGRPVAVA